MSARYHTLPAGLLLACLLVLLSACGSTSRNKSNSLYITDQDVAAAQVWFIRPFTYRERGLADNPVKISINSEPLLELGKGEYTFVRLRAGKHTITTSNLSQFTNKLDPVEMTRTVEINMQPEQQYFLHVRQVNEEFRGVYYVIERLDLEAAKALVEGVAATGVPGKYKLNKM